MRIEALNYALRNIPDGRIRMHLCWGNYTDLVGRERVIAGTDCGFGTWAGVQAVDTDNCYAKARGAQRGGAAGLARGWWRRSEGPAAVTRAGCGSHATGGRRS